MHQRIRDLREDRDLTQRQVAEQLNCSQQVYSNYELGQRDIPTDILIRLADFHNVPIDYLLGQTANPKRNKESLSLHKGGGQADGGIVTHSRKQ